MAATYKDNGGSVNGSNKVFTYDFPTLQTEDVKVALNGVTQATTKYTVSLSPANITFNNNSVDSSVQETDGSPKSGVTVRVYRETTVGKASGDEDPRAVFAAGSSIRAGDLNANVEQALFGIHELQEQPVQTESIADGAVNSAKIIDGSIVNADVNASAAIAGTKVSPNFGSQAVSTSGTLASGATTVTGNITVSGTVDGRDVATDGSKLDGIAAGATANQTNAEIRAAVEAASDSNVFTDADHSKLNAIEASATADQTASEIRTLVESASDSNVFTDADHSKLNAIEASADVTDATNVDAAGAVMNSDLDTKGEILVGDGSGDPTALSVGTNGYILTADSSEATGIKWAANAGAGGGTINNVVEDTSPQLGGDLDVNGNDIVSTSNGSINITPNGSGDVVIDGLKYPQADGSAGQFLKTNGSAQLSWAGLDNAAVRTSVEAATDSNVFTDADHTKLNAIEASADVTDATNVNAAGAIMEADVDAKGDILAATADNTVSRLAVGSNTQVLTADSSTATGLAWAAASSGTITALNNQAANRLTTIGSTTTQLDGEASLTFEDTTSTGLISGKQITGRGFECPATVSDDWTIAAGNNAFFPGPMTVAASKTVTVPANRTLTIV